LSGWGLVTVVVVVCNEWTMVMGKEGGEVGREEGKE
jgi:hypothetical protein